MSDDEMPKRYTPESRPEEIGLDPERLELLHVRIERPLLYSTAPSRDSTSPFGAYEAHSGTANGVFSRARNFGAGNNGYRLVTTFIPEPSTALLLSGGLIALALRTRRASA